MSSCWVQTYTGKAFDLLEPTVDMVDPYDIAVSLADKPRYSRHSRLRITVGQHSILCAAAAYRAALEGLGVPEALRRARLLLLHDAAEAYIGDVVGPARMAIKQLCCNLVERVARPSVRASELADLFDLFGKLDAIVSGAVFKRFGITPAVLSKEDRELILSIDRACLLFEKHWFVQTPEPKPWRVVGAPLELAVFGAGTEEPKSLECAVLVTRPWGFEETLAAFLILLERLGLVSEPWTAERGEIATAYPDFITGFPQGFEIVRRLFPVKP